jgi:hypothetical protein
MSLQVMISAVGGFALVVAGFRVSFLNWMVDAPGRLVNRFTSTDFHEGDGAFGFFLALFLAWLWLSVAVWFALFGLQRIARRTRKRAR